MEFERKISLSALEKGPRTLKFEADEAERAALAARFDLLELKEFSGDATATPEKSGGGIVISGRFRAKLIQSCGITLEPVHDKLSDSFLVRFVKAPDGDAAAEAVLDLSLDVENDQDIEILAGDEIDVGEVAAQYLGTALNPYPRRKGVTAAELPLGKAEIISEEEAREKANPFSLLKNLWDRD